MYRVGESCLVLDHLTLINVVLACLLDPLVQTVVSSQNRSYRVPTVPIFE